MSRIAALLLLATCAPACGQTDAPMLPPPDAAATAETPGLMGRYRFDLPPGFAWTGGSVSYEYFNSQAEPWPGASLEGDARDAAFSAAVAERLAFVQSNEPPSELEGIVETAFIETREITVPSGRAAWAALSYDGPYGTEEARRWDVLLDAGPVLVEAEYVSDEAPEASLALVVERLGAVRVPGDAGFGEADWLYGGGYALALPEGKPESTTAGYQGPLGSLGGGTSPPGSVSTPLRIRIAMAEGEIQHDSTTEYEVLRNQSRAAGGRPGGEAVDEWHTSEGQERDHQWESPGPGSVLSLSYGFESKLGEPPLPPREETLAVWDALLASLRAVTP